MSLILAIPSTSLFGESVTLVEDGVPKARIFLPAKALEEGEGHPLVIGAQELNYHLLRMSGAELEVLPADSAADISAPAIVLGELAAKLGADPQTTPYEDSIRIVTKDGKVLIVGESDEATLDGVSTLLMELGVDWVMPGEIGEVIPKRETVTVPAMDLTQTPSFALRGLWYRGGTRINTEQDYAEFAQWKRRQRMSDGVSASRLRNPNIPPLGVGHMWDQLIKRNQEAFDENPELLALVRDTDGNLVRRGPQIESTHPGIVDLVVAEIRAKFEKEGWPKDHPAAFPIGPADGLGYSISTESQLAGAGRIDPIMGDPDTTDLVVLLGNQILEKIEAEFPNVSLGFYSYSTHADFPLRHKPHPRLQQIFAPINFSRFHGPFDENSKTWPFYRRVIEQWGELSREQGNLLVYRGYNWNLAENMVPYSQLRVVGEKLPWYHEHNFLGVTIEATKAWAVNGPHDYLLAKMLWDVDLDWKDVIADYCAKAFGKGAEPMREYLLDLTNRQHDAGQEAGSFHALHLIYDDAFVTDGMAKIEAVVAAAELPAEKTRAGYFRYPLEALGEYLKYFHAAGEFDFAAAKEHFNRLYEIWEEAYAINTQIVAKEVPQYLDRFLKKFVEQAAEYSAPPYRIIHKIPDKLQTMLDPLRVGDQLNFANPALNDTHYFTTRTWSAPWDAQGLGAYRSGAVWYRIPFELPELKEGEYPGLFLGGVEDEAVVWLNGELLGSSGRMFSAPFLFDLGEFAKPGQENLLVVQVIRNSSANEIGLGGILRPSFVFAGPRVDPPVPDSGQPRHRILPGGEVDESATE